MGEFSAGREFGEMAKEISEPIELYHKIKNQIKKINFLWVVFPELKQMFLLRMLANGLIPSKDVHRTSIVCIYNVTLGHRKVKSM